MRLPSSSSEPNASASPVAQSMRAALQHCLLGFELAGDAGMHLEPGRHARQRLANLLERGFRNGGGLFLVLEFDVRRMEPGPVALQPIRLVRLVGLGGLVCRLHRSLELVPHRLPVRRGHHALGCQSFGIQRARGLLGGDRAIHLRLGERRLVGLVVAVAAVADDVQHEVGGEPHAEFGRHARAEHHRLGIVAVDVQDRRLDRLRHIGAIKPGIGVRRHGGEADLVVDDHMHGAAGAVADAAGSSPASRTPGPGRRTPRRRASGSPSPNCVAACRPRCPAAHAPCRRRRGSPPPDATDWAAARCARCARRCPRRSRCRDGI